MTPDPTAAVAAALAATARRVAALVAPPVCLACRAPQGPADALALCPGCLRELPWTGPDACRRCGSAAHDGRACPARDAPWRTAWAPVAYAGPAAALVRALKFDGALPALDLMAAQIATNLPGWSRPRGAPMAVVPVPAVAVRRRRRGFDVADGLATRVAARLGLPVARPLVRHGRARQLGADRAARRDAHRLDVRAMTGAAPATDTVLLVDDVHTTGATLRAATGALVQAGVPRVHVVSYARVR